MYFLFFFFPEIAELEKNQMVNTKDVYIHTGSTLVQWERKFNLPVNLRCRSVIKKTRDVVRVWLVVVITIIVIFIYLFVSFFSIDLAKKNKSL